MDVFCPICGEPWEHDCLHEEASARYGISYGTPEYDSEGYGKVFQIVGAEFRAKGCCALQSAYGPMTSCTAPNAHKAESEAMQDRADVASAMYDLLGDDMDGAAAMLEDWEAGY